MRWLAPAPPDAPWRRAGAQGAATADGRGRDRGHRIDALVRRIVLAPDPQDVAADARGGTVVVASPAAHGVTLLVRDGMDGAKVLGGFTSPHIAEIAPDGDHAYVTDDTRGTLSAIDLFNRRVTSTIVVGAGAHHMVFDMLHPRVWVALGESARQIVVLDTSDLAHPRPMARSSSPPTTAKS